VVASVWLFRGGPAQVRQNVYFRPTTRTGVPIGESLLSFLSNRMKHLSTMLWVLLFGLAGATARAQNYRPFRFGLSYQLSASTTPGDTTHLLRLESRQVQAGDSVFGFSPRTSRRVAGAVAVCGSYVRRPDNLFGTTLRLRPGGEYVLATANGNTFSLRPRAPLGQAWPATVAGLTGRVTARTLGSVLGQADSLATITLSDGAVVVLSRRFGWVSGPALGRYLAARLPQATLTLTALPELGLGSNLLGAFAVYDFQPGDVFLRKSTTITYLGVGANCTAYQWTRDSIISRTLSANGDTLRYQQRTRTLQRDCAGRPTLGPATVQTVRITRATGQLNQPTGFWGQSTSAASVGTIHLAAYRTADYYQRPVQRHLQYQQCGAATVDSTMLFDTRSLDFGFHTWTAPGLGITRTEVLSFSTEIIDLLGYRKGAENWGQLTPFAQLLATRDYRPASTTAAYPNPFAAELAVAFELKQTQAVRLTLRDALGRMVLEQAAGVRPAGAQRLTLVTAGLPGGVYTLHLQLVGEARTEVLRVLKAQ
jgi:hypothetical protein